MKIEQYIIEKRILMGETFEDIVIYAEDEPTLRRYHKHELKRIYAKARQHISELEIDDLKGEKNLAYLRLNDLYSKSYQTKDYANCLKIQHEITDTFGLKTPEKIDIDLNLMTSLEHEEKIKQMIREELNT